MKKTGVQQTLTATAVQKERTVVTGGVHDAHPTDEAVSVLALRAARSRTLTTQTVLLTPEDVQKNFT